MRGLKRLPKGLSLMEMLVVLVLVSLMATLLVQGTMFLYGNYARVSDRFTALQSGQLPNRWYRESVSRLVASLDDNFAMTGRADFFEGYTLAPVTKPHGSLTNVRWRVSEEDGIVSLTVSQNGEPPLEVRRWRGRDARFVYYVDHREKVGQWPTDDETRHLLPAAIELRVSLDNGQQEELLTSVDMRLRAPGDYRDLL